MSKGVVAALPKLQLWAGPTEPLIYSKIGQW